MFPLETTQYPADRDGLVTSLTASLNKLFTLSPGKEPVTLSGADWKSADLFRLDLDGASVRPEAKPRKPGTAVDRQRGFAARQLQVSGNPLRYQQAQALFTLSGTNVAFDFGRDPAGKIMAILTAASDGKFDASIAKADLEAILLAGAKPQAGAHGVAVERIEITLSSAGPRSVSVAARITAKKIFAAIVRLNGRIDIDENLVATLSGLSAAGEGMAGKMVVGFIQPMLDKANGQQIPLMSFSLGDLRLRDLRIGTVDGLQVSAQFGS